MIVWYVLFAIIFPSSLYLFGFALISWFHGNRKIIDSSGKHAQSVCVCVPCYGNDSTVLYTVKQNLKLLRQGHFNFTYLILSDHQSPATIEELKALQVSVFEVNLKQSTKAKAISQFFEKEKVSDDLFLLLDIDNVLSASSVEALGQIAKGQLKQKQWYQFERVSANENSKVAVLDTWSEKINNRIFRRGCQTIGVAPALIGSGILAPMKEYKDFNLRIPEFITGGFDKWLDHMLLQEKVAVKYVEGALVYDEKISNLDQLQTQRTRWISAQIFIAKKLFVTTLKSLFTLRLLRFFKYAQLYIIPRVWHMMLSFLAAALALLFAPELGWQLMVMNFITLCFGLLLASKGVNLLILTQAIFSLAFKIVWRYIKVVFGLKEAEKGFAVTEHSKKDQ